ncbi:hypothetical protein [Pleionea sediminis]|uniref:hypothetical protein n=1 Tax=Pleionea sediminis TaxID=2569479 RepID=UPI00118684A2|nr:hypothetical protein [Pleionea sediminis]
MNRLILILTLAFSVAYAEDSIKFIDIFSGSYELPKHCKNYPRENDDNYNIYCEGPNFEYFVAIESDDKPCALRSDYKLNERVAYKVEKDFTSQGLVFLQVKIDLKYDSEASTVTRTISSDKECLTIYASKVAELDLVKIGNWY